MPTDAPSPGDRSPSTMRARNALLARAGIARTFGGLGSFLAVIFLGAGIYLLQESFTDPLPAQALGLIAGAFIIALATILIYFILTPRKKSQIQERGSQVHEPVHSLVATAPSLAAPKETAKTWQALSPMLESGGADLRARNRREIALF
jgi:hypothetical protein